MLQHIRNYLTANKAKTLCNGFISSQFFLCAFNSDVCRETVNFKNRKNQFSIAISGIYTYSITYDGTTFNQ